MKILFDAVFYPGCHGPAWDLSEDVHSAALIEAMLSASKPVVAVCHAPGVLRNAKMNGKSKLKLPGSIQTTLQPR